MSDYDYEQSKSTDAVHDASNDLVNAMQRQLNLQYFRLGRQAVLDCCCWYMDRSSIELLRSHMAIDGPPARCAGLPIVVSATSGWSLGRLPAARASDLG